ncbi:unnamed protein product [Peniophora sp. CBMAI 1063]|nr:unnamed protein product [Peniophora sp. CBMAI 1063]
MDILNRRPQGEPVLEDGFLCSVCFQECTVNRRCSVCKLVYYCGTKCQTAYWNAHKEVCTHDTVRAARREDKILALQHNIIDVNEICFVLSKLACHLLALRTTPDNADNTRALHLLWDLHPTSDGRQILHLLRASMYDIPPDDSYYHSPTALVRRPTALSEMHEALVVSGQAQWVAVVPVFSRPNFEKRHNAMVAAGRTSIYVPAYVDILNLSSADAHRLDALAQLEMMYGFPEATYAQALVRQVNDIIAADTENRHGWRTRRRSLQEGQ